MNTIGKILVILNFLFAMIVGFLLVIDIAMRNKWKEAFEDLERQVKVIEDSRTVQNRVATKIVADYNARQKEIDDAKQLYRDEVERRKSDEADFKVRLDKVEAELRAKQLTIEEAQKAVARHTQEIGELTKTVGEREKAIVEQQANVKTLRTAAVTYESQARTRQIQNETLLEQVRGLTQELARKEAGVVGADVMVIRNPNEPNPPAVQVSGKIERVDSDLVQLTLGTDHGVNKNHTLDVYRLQPEPKYLGMVRIVDANHHQSVGRLVPSGNAAFRTPLRVGDLVTSRLTK